MKLDRDEGLALRRPNPIDDGDLLRQQVQAQAVEIERLQLLQRDQARGAAELEAQLAAMRASSSWRGTAALRAVAQALRWLASDKPRFIGVQCLGLLRREWRRRGLFGVLARLPRYLDRAPIMVKALDARSAIGLAETAAPRVAPHLHPEWTLADGQPPCLEVTISVVIPTLNAGPEFAYLLRKLRGQSWVRRIEIVVIDSGSTDGTVELCRAAGATLVEIAASEFSHSGARNLGAETASGDYLLFMVQDAYPIGDRWAYGLLRYLLDHQDQGMVAVSCTEYCRDDSDIMVECSIATHYGFLGCKEFDRIGEFRGADQESLRAMGQLSDVSCLIPRLRFLQYRYRGNFAEDLDLGVRLIRDGHRIAMLASVKVIHSHNRTSHYYLKRTFVDIKFLVNVFEDFRLPPCESALGLITGAAHVARQVSAWIDLVTEQGGAGSMHQATERWLIRLRRLPIDAALTSQPLELGDARVGAFVRELTLQAQRLPTPAAPDAHQASVQRSAQYFLDDFVMRFDHFNRYATQVYPGEDERLRREWIGAAGKTFASSLGFTLAGLYLDRRDRPEDDAERRWLDQLAAQLTAGI